jgi:hypothetical protein
MVEELTRKEAIKFLDIPEKNFDNYFKSSKEIKGFKKGARWYFNKDELVSWNDLKKKRTINLTLHEYEKCFEFAIKMIYGGLSLHGIRGKRSEVQATDDVILGILAEHAIKKFLKDRFNTEIELDEEVHTAYITPQDFHTIKDGKKFRPPKLGVGVKASKLKNAFLVLGQNEVERVERKSDVYIFARVGLPSDHLFRILRDHSFFKNVTEFLENSEGFRKIKKLKEIPVWICGFNYFEELEKVTEIPGQQFDNGYRYIKSVANMHNSDNDWKKLIKRF